MSTTRPEASKINELLRSLTGGKAKLRTVRAVIHAPTNKSRTGFTQLKDPVVSMNTLGDIHLVTTVLSGHQAATLLKGVGNRSIYRLPIKSWAKSDRSCGLNYHYDVRSETKSRRTKATTSARLTVGRTSNTGLHSETPLSEMGPCWQCEGCVIFGHLEFEKINTEMDRDYRYYARREDHMAGLLSNTSPRDSKGGEVAMSRALENLVDLFPDDQSVMIRALINEAVKKTKTEKTSRLDAASTEGSSRLEHLRSRLASYGSEERQIMLSAANAGMQIREKCARMRSMFSLSGNCAVPKGVELLGSLPTNGDVMKVWTEIRSLSDSLTTLISDQRLAHSVVEQARDELKAYEEENCHGSK